MANPAQDPAEGSRKTALHELARNAKNRPSTADEHMENQEGAAKATKDNDLTTGHSHEGDGGDDNSKRKNS